jgi:hypothetical protein
LETDPEASKARDTWDRLAKLYQRSEDYLSAADAFVRASSYGSASLSYMSNVAHWLNTNRMTLSGYERAERDRPFHELIALMEPRIGEATSNDLSRLAWVHLHVGNISRAKELAELGQEKDPDNIHCERLLRRLEESAGGAFI